jgi:small subunit ribosomal protein S10
MPQKKNNQLKIIIYSYDVNTIEEATKLVAGQVSQLKMKFSGPIPLPTKKLVVTVPISPHKHKTSQEQFVRETHRRVINILDISPRDLESLKNLKIPNTAGIKLKTSF